jgi:MoaA/NifB/PqqE/SkfB family radical SAM enzyme
MFNPNTNKIKYLKIGYKKIVNFWQSWIFIKTGLSLPRPLKVYYLISNKCNFKCQFCPQWQDGINENSHNYIDKEKIKKIIDEMATLGIKEFGISGGEPLLYKDKTLDLLAYANKKGIYTHFATNGSLLSEEILDAYNKIGGGHISLSVDAIGEKHDELRGFSGAYDLITKVLVSAKKFKNINLKINFTLNNENLNDAVKVAKLAIGNQAMIFIQPYDTYAYGLKDTGSKETNYPLWVKRNNYKLLNDVIGELVNLKKAYPQFILNDKKHLQMMNNYFSDNKFETNCLAGLDQIAINPDGKIIFCKFGEIGDLKTESLTSFINSSKRQAFVSASLKCHEGCLLGCMFRPSFYDLILNGTRQFIRLIRN